MQPRLIMLDADGVLWRGASAIPEAPPFVRAARAAGIRCVLVSNNAGPDRALYLEKCRRLGLDFAAEDIFSVNHLAGPYIARLQPGARVLVLGSPELVRSIAAHCSAVGAEEWLAQRGVPPLAEGRGRATTYGDLALVRQVECDIVFVGIDHDATYLKLALACAAVQRGARLIGANQDLTYPVEDGLVLPGNGSSVRLLEGVCAVRAHYIGKPEPYLIEQIEADTGIPRTEMLMIGDRPETDIEFARRAGVASFLVLTGVVSAAQVPADISADAVCATLADVAAKLKLPPLPAAATVPPA